MTPDEEKRRLNDQAFEALTDAGAYLWEVRLHLGLAYAKLGLVEKYDESNEVLALKEKALELEKCLGEFIKKVSQ